MKCLKIENYLIVPWKFSPRVNEVIGKWVEETTPWLKSPFIERTTYFSVAEAGDTDTLTRLYPLESRVEFAYQR